MNDFNTWYLALLRKQVEDEIQFLKTNRHEERFNTEPCMFCVSHGKGQYFCNRLRDLRDFHSRIMQEIKSKSNKNRRPIGQEPDRAILGNIGSVSKPHEMPLLFPEL